MKMFFGELLDVQTGDYNSLVFASMRYDRGLQKNVECSEQIAISDECLDFVPNYKKHIGEKICIGINPLVTKKNTIFLLTTTDVLDLSQVLTNE